MTKRTRDERKGKTSIEKTLYVWICYGIIIWFDDLETSTLYVVGANDEIDTKNEEELYVHGAPMWTFCLIQVKKYWLLVCQQ